MVYNIVFLFSKYLTMSVCYFYGGWCWLHFEIYIQYSSLSGVQFYECLQMHKSHVTVTPIKIENTSITYTPFPQFPCATSFSCTFFLKKFIYLFIYFWLHWVFIAVHRLPLVTASRGYTLLQCVGFSLRWLLLPRSKGSRCVGSVVVARRLSSCGAQA